MAKLDGVADAGGLRYSAERSTKQCEQSGEVWTYRTGANDTLIKAWKRKAAFESTPILVRWKLLPTTPYDHVIAPIPGTGAKLWEYDPGVNLDQNFSEVSSRGSWLGRIHTGKALRLAACVEIFIGTLDARLTALMVKRKRR